MNLIHGALQAEPEEAELHAAGTGVGTLARVAGALYLAQMATGVGAFYAKGQLVARGDASLTAANIMGAEQQFRLSVAGDMITSILVLLLVWSLYVILRPASRKLALLGLIFRVVENGVLYVCAIGSLVVLGALAGYGYMDVFSPQQLHSLARFAISVQGMGVNTGFVLLGTGSAVFALAFYRSRYVPRAIAVLGVFASLLLATGSLANVVFPVIWETVGIGYMLPMGLYEVSLGLWLLIKGIRLPATEVTVQYMSARR
jgi:hypothetical protein